MFMGWVALAFYPAGHSEGGLVLQAYICSSFPGSPISCLLLPVSRRDTAILFIQ